jgi:hypothetical protein
MKSHRIADNFPFDLFEEVASPSRDKTGEPGTKNSLSQSPGGQSGMLPLNILLSCGTMKAWMWFPDLEYKSILCKPL